MSDGRDTSVLERIACALCGLVIASIGAVLFQLFWIDLDWRFIAGCGVAGFLLGWFYGGDGLELLLGILFRP